MKRNATNSILRKWDNNAVVAQKAQTKTENLQAPAEPKPAHRSNDKLINSAQAFLAHVGSRAA